MTWQAIGLLFFGAVSIAECQLVQVGPIDPNYCQKIKVSPNLVLREKAQLSGRVIDQTGTPFRKSRIELRAFISPLKQIELETTTTDEDGQFRLKPLSAGRYRLLASPTRAFQQTEALTCDQSVCEFKITLKVNPSDMPDSQCPIR